MTTKYGVFREEEHNSLGFGDPYGDNVGKQDQRSKGLNITGTVNKTGKVRSRLAPLWQAPNAWPHAPPLPRLCVAPKPAARCPACTATPCASLIPSCWMPCASWLRPA